MLTNGHPARMLEPGESVVAGARAREGTLAVTEQRIAVTTETGRLALDLPMGQLRRIQFDIERTRPAILVIVPDRAGLEPQVLSIPPEEIDAATVALAFIAKRLPQPDLDGATHD